MDFKHWLEAISIGVMQSSFWFDPEGEEIMFNFKRESWDKEVLTISELYGNDKTFIKAEIDRRQIVKAFYLGLLNFAASDKFKSEEWEVEYLGERLCEIFNMDEESLIEQLIELDREKLSEVLFKADPSYTISFPTAKDKSEEMMLFIETSVQNKELPKEHTMKRTPNEWNIPEDYNFWSVYRKREYVIRCLNVETEGNSGTKIKDFRSSIIEEYLNSK